MKKTFSLIWVALLALQLSAQDLRQLVQQHTQFEIGLKHPGNPAAFQTLEIGDNGQLTDSGKKLPLEIQMSHQDQGESVDIRFEIKAKEDVYFNFSGKIRLEGLSYASSQMLLPGFWYRKNQRSPENAPAARVSTDWLVREDRLSSPVTSLFDSALQTGFALVRKDELKSLGLTTHQAGEVILGGKTDLGALGFGQKGDVPFLHFAFPYAEAPKTYLRKLTLAPAVTAFEYLPAGESITLTYRLSAVKGKDFSAFVAGIWEHSYDLFKPEVLHEQEFSDDEIKAVLSNFFKESYVEFGELKGYSGVHLQTETCEPYPILEIGFIGRVLLNAFNALEYGEATGQEELVRQARAVLDSYEQNGFNSAGLIREFIDFGKKDEPNVYSIRRQSEGIYAILLYLDYEKRRKRQHPLYEQKVRELIGKLLQVQQADGSFPRKFDSSFKLIDPTGGSSPSAVLPLVMAYKYFKNNSYLDAARKVAVYQEREIIAPGDYFSSTLDADCEDKEASLYAATAMYYLAHVTKGKEKQHYIDLAKKAAYFTLSWYYTWDVPFAQGQMLGDIGLKSRGWGNVSVENNHIDVFIFEFDEVLDWLAAETGEQRFSSFAKVIRSSMREQLLPRPGNMMGIGKVGYYPEVVQHTAWDYGKNGKGYYNDLFAPGWTVASLWELLTVGRTEKYLK